MLERQKLSQSISVVKKPFCLFVFTQQNLEINSKEFMQCFSSLSGHNIVLHRAPFYSTKNGFGWKTTQFWIWMVYWVGGFFSLGKFSLLVLSDKRKLISVNSIPIWHNVLHAKIPGDIYMHWRSIYFKCCWLRQIPVHRTTRIFLASQPNHIKKFVCFSAST